MDTFVAFCRDTYPGLVAQLVAYTGDVGEAQDVAQEVYVRGCTTWAGFRRRHRTGSYADLPGCFGFPDATVLDPPTDRPWGDEAVTGSVALPADGAGEHTGTRVRMVVVRVGTAVATFSGHPQIPDIDNDAQAIVGRLCLYNPQCRPPAGLPPPLGELHEGGQAWAAVLDEFATGDVTATPGVAMAAAAELGYHPAIVPAECDGGTAGRSAVTVYLTNRADAERFAGALPTLRVQVREVTTHCVHP